MCKKARDIGMELHEDHFLKLVYEYLQIQFSVPDKEQVVCNT